MRIRANHLKICGFCTLIILLSSAISWAQENPIGVSIRAFIVNSDGTFTEASTAEGGDEIEYRVIATNNDPTTLPAGTVMLNGPVPASSTYVSGSATKTEELTTEFSSDSRTFDSGEVYPVQLVRWTLLQPFEPGASFEVSYRVKIDGTASNSGSRPASDIDCDEVTESQAQAILQANLDDPYDLDRDGDGDACEPGF